VKWRGASSSNRRTRRPCRLAAASFGSRPFSKINAALRAAGKPEINWQIPEQ
jgi:uracil DNA glycosylase